MSYGQYIQINSAIFPSVMEIVMSPPDHDNSGNKAKAAPLSHIELPRGASLLYLQQMVNRGASEERTLLEKYANGIEFTSVDYERMIDYTMHSHTASSTASSSSEPTTHEILDQLGLSAYTDSAGQVQFSLQESAVEKVRADTWDCILIDHLRAEARNIIDCFDFQSAFQRVSPNTSGREELQYSLWAWHFSSDVAEQSLSSALRIAFFFTLIQYRYSQSRSTDNFNDFFEMEFMTRVNLIHQLWVSRNSNTGIRYLPLFDSFYNLKGITKAELLPLLRHIFDCDAVSSDDKAALLHALVSGAEIIHQQRDTNPDAATLEQDLIKPTIGVLFCLEHAKESLAAAELLLNAGRFADCANRSYYSMMYALKAFLEYRGQLPAWKPDKLKGAETHKQLLGQLRIQVRNSSYTAAELQAYEFVETQRMQCDYELHRIGKADAELCVKYSQDFLRKTQRLIPS